MAHSTEHQHSTCANVLITLKELFFVLGAKFVDFSRNSIEFTFPLYLHGWNCSYTLKEAERAVPLQGETCPIFSCPRAECLQKAH